MHGSSALADTMKFLNELNISRRQRRRCLKMVFAHTQSIVGEKKKRKKVKLHCRPLYQTLSATSLLLSPCVLPTGAAVEAAVAS